MQLTKYRAFLTALNYLESLGNLKEKDFFAGTKDPRPQFKRMQHLLKLAGNPDKNLKIIHITGTSGKGSTANHIYNILQKAGYKVGAYFSPHVSVPTEKIQINNKFISTDEFCSLVEKMKPIIERCYKTLDTPSHFEVWFLLSLLYFKEQKCDYVVLEVGCGGRHDATNAVQKTILSTITNIGLDHTHILGNTYEEIAYEKAGIIRPKGVVFTATERPSALKVIQDEADKKKADLTILQNQDDPNAALAIAMAEHLNISEKHITQGLKQKKLPARFEIIQKKPFVILDGAHNIDKMNFFINKLNHFKSEQAPKAKIIAVCALTSQKDSQAILTPLFNKADKILLTRFTTTFRKVTPPLEIQKHCPLKKLISVYLNPEEALKHALKIAKPEDIVVITGSFFLCGDLRGYWHDEVKQLEKRTNFV